MDELPSGRELALEDLRWLRALAANLVRDPHLADDAVQETLVVALEQRPRAAGSLRAWLASVLRNALRQEWRGRARRTRREAQTLHTESERSTLEVVEELALHRRLVERVQALDEPYRTAVVLRYLRGREVAEIARELGVPPKTVRTRLERALAQLRERLGGERQAWLALLFPTPPPSLAPALPVLLLPMNSKALVAALALLLAGIGAFFYVRSSPSRPPALAEPSQPLIAATPSALPEPREAAPVLPAREAAASSSAPAPAAAIAAAPSELHGFVRTLDGAGIEGIEVVFEPGSRMSFASAADSPRAMSGRAGEFALPCPEAGGRLNVRSEHYVGLVQPQLDGSAPLAPPIVVVAPLRSYSGRVVDESGAPLALAEVELTFDGSFIQSRDVGGEAVHLILPFAETTCDEQGVFRFERAGFVAEAFLAARADGYREGRLELPADSRDDLELVLARAPSGPRTIFGLVLDAREEPVAGAQVSLAGPSVETDADGAFRLECEPWRKAGWIRAFHRGALPAELPLEKALAASSPERPLVLRLGGEPLAIRGRLLDADGAPVAGACVWTSDTTPFGEIVTQEGEHSFSGGTTVEAYLAGNTEPWASQVKARTDAEGRFALAGLLERDYVLFALDARTLDGVGPVVVGAGEEHVELRLAGAPRARLAGRVRSRSGEPLAGVSVAPARGFDWQADEGEGQSRWAGFAIRSPSAAQYFPESAAVTDAEGRFELGPLVVEGTYLVLRGKALALGNSFELAGMHDLSALEIAVDASSRFRVVLANAADADAFRLEELDGSQVPLFLEAEGLTISAGTASIERGQSGVVMIAEGKHVVVLLVGEEEVHRVVWQFPAGGLHEVRL